MMGTTKRKILKKWVRYSILFLIVGFITLSFFLIFSSIKKPKEEDNVLLYAYNIKQKQDYKIYLKDNSYIESDYLEKNKSYIADLIKKIDVNYDYNFSGSKVVPLSYTYNVKAVINGEYNIDEEQAEVWTKEYELVKNTKKSSNDKTNININEKIEIDYNLYDKVVSDFRQDLKLPIKATLSVIFQIDVETSVNGKVVNDTKTMTLKIPLNQIAFKITEEYEPFYGDFVVPDHDNKPKIEMKKMIPGISIIIASVVSFVLLFRDIFNIPKKNKYVSRLSKILKEYGDVIVEVVNPVNEENVDLIEVKSFDEMIDLEEELRVPIMFYETIEFMEGEFTLIHNNILYKYVLKNE